MTWNDFENKVKGILDMLKQIESFGIPIAEIFAPQAAPELAAAQVITTAVDKAVTDHVASGNSTASAVSALTTIAASVVDSGLLHPSDSDKIKAVINVVDPSIYQGGA